ncbi:LysR family transcriptional regulator, partial [Pseudomonas stutzeri]|nr:LysR family transcriptional regulator [Stutzerimonas stutzeri]
MDRFQAVEAFARVIEAGSFRRAAETLHVLPSTVTRTIKELESHLGTRLLNRTTRAISATDAGLRYYDSCKSILRELYEAEALASQRPDSLRGTI